MTIAVHQGHPSIGLLAFALRLVRGAAHNFAIRVSDWFAASVMLSFGMLLMLCGVTLGHDRTFGLLWQYAPPWVWGYVCLLIGVGRIAALVVNGTFPSFRWSPHIRMAMAAFSVFVWFQITLGVLARDGGSVMIAFFPNLFLFDLYNLFLAASEAGVSERRIRHVGG
jgi:hypothetical protein